MTALSPPAASTCATSCDAAFSVPGDDADPASACRALVLGPQDSADVVGWFHVEDRAGTPRRETVVVVLHRSAGAWTHVYRIVEPARGRHQVKLEKVFSGDRSAVARAWAEAVLNRPLARPLP